jgi:Fic family protein
VDNRIYIFKLAPDWKLINKLSDIDRFGGSWEAIEKRERQMLKELKSIATVRSVGASTRIEGAKMTDDEVASLIQNLTIAKLEERDQQEVAGYFETLDLISESYRDIEITENNLKHLHNVLMKYSGKDAWHKGNYKQASNEVEATRPDGSKYTIFKTSEPGLVTDDAMRAVVEWYRTEKEAHPLVRAATFIYEFLSIHPFQDGNGRLSRLLATLFLLKEGYSWIEYVSFEHEIENRKSEYYQSLMSCQRQRPGEDIHDWLIFFLDCLTNIQRQLLEKLETKNIASKMSPREKKIYQFIGNHPGIKSGEIAQKLNIPLPTVKRLISEMLLSKLLQKHGTGAGTNYSVEEVIQVKKDLLIKFTDTEKEKNFVIKNSNSFIELKKIILTPKFDWTQPDEWATKLSREGLYLKLTVETNNESIFSQPFTLSRFNNPYLFQPVFTLSQPINIPKYFESNGLYENQYPLKVKIELQGSVDKFSFDVLVVYDEH